MLLIKIFTVDADKFLKNIVDVKAEGKRQITLPSYLFLEKTSGAIYAGVPTVDFGWECNTDD